MYKYYIAKNTEVGYSYVHVSLDLRSWTIPLAINYTTQSPETGGKALKIGFLCFSFAVYFNVYKKRKGK